MSSQPTRIRPIVRFAEAASKCTTEVCFQWFSFAADRPSASLPLKHVAMATGRCVRQMHRRRLQQRTQRHVRCRVYAIEGLLPCQLDFGDCARQNLVLIVLGSR